MEDSPTKFHLREFKTVRSLGHGKFGKVLLVKTKVNHNVDASQPPDKNRPGDPYYFAIKIVDTKALEKPVLTMSKVSNLSKIQSEIHIINIINRYSHPNLVQLYSIIRSESNDRIYFIMHFCPLGELNPSNFTRSPNSIDACCNMQHKLADIIHGLEFLHAQRIVHRDIKPSNLLVDATGSVQISDFGTCYQLTDDCTADSFEILRKLAGTPLFLPPEICCNECSHGNEVTCKDYEDKSTPNARVKSTTSTSRPFNRFLHALKMHRSSPKQAQDTPFYAVDFWALGITLYYLVFQCFPFYDENEFCLFNDIVKKPAPIPPCPYEDVTLFGRIEDQRLHSGPGLESFYATYINFLRGLLVKDPSKRLTLHGIKHHKLMKMFVTKEEYTKFIHFNHKYVKCTNYSGAPLLRNDYVETHRSPNRHSPNRHSPNRHSPNRHSPSQHTPTSQTKHSYSNDFLTDALTASPGSPESADTSISPRSHITRLKGPFAKLFKIPPSGSKHNLASIPKSKDNLFDTDPESSMGSDIESDDGGLAPPISVFKLNGSALSLPINSHHNQLATSNKHHSSEKEKHHQLQQQNGYQNQPQPDNEPNHVHHHHHHHHHHHQHHLPRPQNTPPSFQIPNAKGMLNTLDFSRAIKVGTQADKAGVQQQQQQHHHHHQRNITPTKVPAQHPYKAIYRMPSSTSSNLSTKQSSANSSMSVTKPPTLYIASNFDEYSSPSPSPLGSTYTGGSSLSSISKGPMDDRFDNFSFSKPKGSGDSILTINTLPPKISDIPLTPELHSPSILSEGKRSGSFSRLKHSENINFKRFFQKSKKVTKKKRTMFTMDQYLDGMN